MRRIACLLLLAGGARGEEGALEALLAELDAEVSLRREGGRGAEALALAAEVLALRRRAEEGAPPGASTRAEAHVVAVREGIPPSGEVRVRVTATGRPIVLVVASEAPLRWYVDRAKGVDLRRVCTAGYQELAVWVPAGCPLERLGDTDRGGFVASPELEGLVEDRVRCAVWTSLDPGPKGPVVVGPENPEWRAQHLRTEAVLLHWRATRGRRAAERERLKAFRFGALYRWWDPTKPETLRASFGEWTPLGPLLARQHVLPEVLAVSAAAVEDDGRDEIYLLRHGVLLRFALPSGPPEVLRVPDTLPAVREPCALAVDTRRDRLLLATKHDHGYLYAMDLKSREWSVLNDLDDVDAAGMAYDEQRDAVLCVEYGEEGAVRLQRFSPEDGRRQRETLLRLPPLRDRRPLAAACRKGRLLLLYPPASTLADRDAAESRAFVVESHSGVVLFAARTRPWEDFGPLGEARLEELWNELAAKGGTDAGQAMRELAGQGDAAVALLARRLAPGAGADEDLGRWVALLSDDDALARDLAQHRLVEAGSRAADYLASLDPQDLPPEARRRVAAALRAVGGAGRLQRNLRAVQVLEWIESPAAEALLRDLAANGEPRRRAAASEALALIDRPRR